MKSIVHPRPFRVRLIALPGCVMADVHEDRPELGRSYRLELFKLEPSNCRELAAALLLVSDHADQEAALLGRSRP
jgi:hypothetical protein